MEFAELAAERRRNRPGEGGKLRADIVSAARALLESNGTEAAVTLRATAREAGVTAPALYAHFPDREHIVEAVIAEAFTEFTQFITSEVNAYDDCVTRLGAGCAAYIDYAHRSPATYHILFTRHRPSRLPSVGAAAAEVFQGLVDTITECVAQGRSTSTAPFNDAVLLWVSLHGLASLPPHHPRFPWPSTEQLLGELLQAHAHISPPSERPVSAKIP